jgi:prepilin-type N-terminal cleavage/methylation domain-containing protein
MSGHTHAKQTTSTIVQHPRGFSLIEMMVVLGILVIVLAIVLPAVNGARISARRASSQTTMNNVSTASQQFNLDNRRLPGYFPMSELASTANASRGFTAMDNVLLDLAGAITQAPVNNTGSPCDTANGPKVVEVGPTNANVVRVDIAAYGAAKSTAGVVKQRYLALDNRNFKRQCAVTLKRAGAVADHLPLPMLVDAFGNPILAWAQDELLVPNAPFASEDYSTRARFYRVTNKAFLDATAMGETGENQTNALSGSLLSGANTLVSMEGLLGNPSSPNPNDATKAADPRAKLVLHSAGHNGIFVGRKERGGKTAGATGLQYQPATGTTNDPANDGRFDDLFVNVQ